VALGLEFYQADEALVSADGLHFLRLVDDLAVSVAWAPADLWQRWPAALADATEAQRDELSLALVRCLVLDKGAGGPVPETLTDALQAIGLEAAALRPALGVGAALGLLLPADNGSAQEAFQAAPVAGCAARVVAPDGSLVQWGKRGLLQWRSPLATRGDWLDAWRPVGWQNTGHVALIDARGVSVLAWQGALLPIVTAVTQVESAETVETAVTVETVVTVDAPAMVETPVTVETLVTVEAPATVVTPAIPAAPVQCPLPLDAQPEPTPAYPLPVEADTVLATEPTNDPESSPSASPDERHAGGGVDILSGQSVRLAPGQGLYARLQVLARQRPRDVAILQDTQFVRYHGLVQQIEQWAASLRSVGLQVADRILLAMPRGAEAVASLFALWRIGAVVVPVDTEEDEAFITAVMQSVKPRLLLCHDTLMHAETGARWARLAEGHCPRLGLKELPPAPHLRDEAAPRPDTLACIFHNRYGDAIHGACYTHGDLLLQFQALSAVLNLRANARWLATSDPGSTRGWLESLMPLLAGAMLVVPAGTVLTAERLLVPLREQAITHVLLGSDWLREVLDAGALGRGVTVLATGVRDPDLCVRVVRAGARGLALTLLPDVALCAAIAPLTPAGAEQGVIGEPLLNLGFALLSPGGEAATAPGNGEWIVRGDGVSQGFWHDDGYQASRYVTLQGERYLRTGVEVVAGSLPFDSALVFRLV
jgi:non-ribosomal peptide synthetase component F